MVAPATRRIRNTLPHDPTDAALELTIRAAARNGRRICIACGEELPLEAFSRAGRGHSLMCARCKQKRPQPPEPRAITDMATAVESMTQHVAGVAERVSSLTVSATLDPDPDPDVEHAELLDPQVTEAIKRYVRGVVKGSAALMVRDLVRGAVREAAREIVPQMVAAALAGALTQEVARVHA